MVTGAEIVEISATAAGLKSAEGWGVRIKSVRHSLPQFLATALSQFLAQFPTVWAGLRYLPRAHAGNGRAFFFWGTRQSESFRANFADVTLPYLSSFSFSLYPPVFSHPSSFVFFSFFPGQVVHLDRQRQCLRP